MDEKEFEKKAYNKLLNELKIKLIEYENKKIEYYKLKAERKLYEDCMSLYNERYYGKMYAKADMDYSKISLPELNSFIEEIEFQIITLQDRMEHNGIKVEK